MKLESTKSETFVIKIEKRMWANGGVITEVNTGRREGWSDIM